MNLNQLINEPNMGLLGSFLLGLINELHVVKDRIHKPLIYFKKYGKTVTDFDELVIRLRYLLLDTKSGELDAQKKELVKKIKDFLKLKDLDNFNIDKKIKEILHKL
jgi:hypothetical protein